MATKRMHGQFPRNLEENMSIVNVILMDKIWRRKGRNKNAIVAPQDQTISTNYFKNNIFKEEIEIRCRLCKQHKETIVQVTSGFSILAKNEYLMRHNKVCAELHCSIHVCQMQGNETTDKWYTHTHTHTHTHKHIHTHTHKPVCENEDITVFWNQRYTQRD